MTLLDNQLQQLGRVALKSGGTVNADAAKRQAEDYYLKFDAARKLSRHREADAAIAVMASEAKSLLRSKK